GPSQAVNVGGLLKLLAAARSRRVKRIVFSSSSAVYGDLSKSTLSETDSTRPISPYGIQKLAGEHYLRVIGGHFGIETVSLRYFNVYGPRQAPGSQYAAVIPNFLALLLAGKAPVIYGDGKQTRDFIYVEDVVAANMLAGETRLLPSSGSEYNVGSGRATSLTELVQAAKEVTGAKIPARFLAPRSGDITHSCADAGRIRKELGFEPAVSLHQGLLRTAAYLRGVIHPL
ncbi:MAG TPA: NAD-dependent epimerase/dehydratase family protein, partial [Chthonomonadales bacterium]|nr:NAD-dependent epimerase/dehydratase family protein [Chthonomonadales bacterium]